jgi:arsenite methyltransferase
MRGASVTSAGSRKVTDDHTVAEAFSLVALLTAGRGAAARANVEPYLVALGYSPSDLGRLPAQAFEAVVACGNPLAFVRLARGDVILDLGCGAGLDLAVASKRIGREGRAIGVDISGVMVAKARSIADATGARNVQVLVADMADLPLRSCSVDVVISNASVNLASNRVKALDEAWRVLRPGGVICFAEAVRRNGMAHALLSQLSAWGDWVGAIGDEREYRRLLEGSGFRDIEARPVGESGQYEALKAVHFLGEKPGGCSPHGTRRGARIAVVGHERSVR